jgi:hypothetical protein
LPHPRETVSPRSILRAKLLADKHRSAGERDDDDKWLHDACPFVGPEPLN